MTVLSRGARVRRGGRRPGWVLLTALLVLAMGASSALVFTNRVELLKLAVILALWAAVAGAFVSVLYRRQSDADQSRARDLKLVYDLQLDREISARREYELTVESQLRRELASEPAPDAALFPEVPFVPLNVGTVEGGSAINVVPERCCLGIGLRPLPSTDVPALVERVRGAARRAVPAPAAAPDLEILSDSPALLVPEDAPFCRYLCALTGQPSAGSVSFATDAGWLQRLGIECVIWGPGSIETAHRPNEWIPKGDLGAARAGLAAAIRHCCVEGD